MLERAARALGPLLVELVFVGGSIIGLYLSDTSSPMPRATEDVDAIVKATTRVEYYRFAELMRNQGFDQALGEPIICRWRGHGLIIDLMPTNEASLGFANRWYASAYTTAQSYPLTGGITIKVIDAAHLLATKLEAFFSRGADDIYASHDLEDIVLLIDNRPELSFEIDSSPAEVKDFISTSCSKLLELAGAKEALEGHLGSTENSSRRLPALIQKFEVLSTK